MNKKKLLNIRTSFLAMMACMIILPLNSNSYSNNAVEAKESSVLCENVNNRGLSKNGNTYLNTDIDFDIEEQVTGIECDLENANENVVIESLNIKYNWTTERVKFRNKPNFNSDIIRTLDKRTKVIILSTDNGWTKTKNNGEVGYIYSKYLRSTELFTSKNNRWGIELTDNEIDLLAKIIWLEARGEEDKNAEIAVIEVIFNRMYSLNYPDSLYGVLSEGNHFSSWKMRNTANPTKKEYNNIQKVLNGETHVLSMDTVYFSTIPRNNNIEAHIDHHYFCRAED